MREEGAVLADEPTPQGNGAAVKFLLQPLVLGAALAALDTDRRHVEQRRAFPPLLFLIIVSFIARAAGIDHEIEPFVDGCLVAVAVDAVVAPARVAPRAEVVAPTRVALPSSPAAPTTKRPSCCVVS